MSTIKVGNKKSKKKLNALKKQGTVIFRGGTINFAKKFAFGLIACFAKFGVSWNLLTICHSSKHENPINYRMVKFSKAQPHAVVPTFTSSIII